MPTHHHKINKGFETNGSGILSLALLAIVLQDDFRVQLACLYIDLLEMTTSRLSFSRCELQIVKPFEFRVAQDLVGFYYALSRCEPILPK